MTFSVKLKAALPRARGTMARWRWAGPSQVWTIPGRTEEVPSDRPSDLVTVFRVEARWFHSRRLSRAHRRQQLVESAVRAFADRGLARAGHSDVARAAGVAVPTAFAYFRTRGELTRAVLDTVTRYFDEMADRHYHANLDAPRALVNHIVAFATSVDSDPDYARVLLEWSTSVRNDAWPLFLDFHERLVRRCEHTIRRGQSEGSIGHDVDAEAAALMLIGSIWMVVQMSFSDWPPECLHRFLLAQLRGAIGADAVARALS